MKISWLFGLMTMGVISIATGQAEPSSDSPIEFRAVSKTADPETQAIEQETKTGSETIYVRKEVVLDAPSFKTAGAAYGTRGWILTIELTEEGAKRFADYCTAHVGDKFAIMVHGKLVETPAVSKSIPHGKMQIGPVTESKALDFAKQTSEVFHK